MKQNYITWNSIKTLALGTTLLFAGIALIFNYSERIIPKKSNLIEVTNRLKYVEKSEGKFPYRSLRFAMHSDHSQRRYDYFIYDDDGGDIKNVLASLENAQFYPVRILFDQNDPSHTPFDERTYYNVLDISIDGLPIRTYEQITASWKKSERYYRIIGYFPAFVGIWILSMFYRKRYGA